MTKTVKSKVIKIATTRFIFNRVMKFTAGCNTMAIINAKIKGTIILLPIYNTVNKAIRPMKKIDAFAYRGNFIFSFVTAFQISLFFCEKYFEKQTCQMILLSQNSEQ